MDIEKEYNLKIRIQGDFRAGSSWGFAIVAEDLREKDFIWENATLGVCLGCVNECGVGKFIVKKG